MSQRLVIKFYFLFFSGKSSIGPAFWLGALLGPDSLVRICNMSTELTQEIHIETDVRFPLNRMSYPFGDMEPGDSFLIPDQRRANSARVASIRFIRKYQPDWEFKMRRVDGGWRLWRVA